MFPTCRRGRVPRRITRSSLGGSGGDAEFAWGLPLAQARVARGSRRLHRGGCCGPFLAVGGCEWCQLSLLS
eukprot:3863298-Pyramimonas_sp.AAC.1